MTNYSIL